MGRRANDYIRGLENNAPLYLRESSKRLEKQFETDAYVVEGIVRWKSNDNIPPTDILEFWDHIGKSFDLEKSKSLDEEESTKFLEEYRKSQENRQYSEEELFEMRAAFGEGETVINVFTGKKTIL